MTESLQCELGQKESVKQEQKKLRICCACPDTRKVRDECILLNGEKDCLQMIEKHKECLRSNGFDV